MVSAAAERQGCRWIIAKAVSDDGDHDKDDGFRHFACRASAEFLLAFLQKHWPPNNHRALPDPIRGRLAAEAGNKK